MEADELRVVDEREKLFGRERESDEGFDGESQEDVEQHVAGKAGDIH